MNEQSKEIVLSVVPGEKALQTAFDSLPPDEEIHVTLELAPGIYREKAELRRANVTLTGTGKPEDTVISWNDCAYEILSDGMKRGTFRSYTLLVDAKDVTLRRLTVENTAGPREKMGQCVALYADGDRFLCEEVILRSHQDTLFTAPLPPKEVEKNGFIGPKQFAPRTPQTHRYCRCTIVGDVDFIFGGAAAWFEDCDIVSEDGRENRTPPEEGKCLGWCTAASTPEGQPFGYVFINCRFTTTNCPPHSIRLGRPWRAFAKTVFLHCWFGEHIQPVAFDDWGKPSIAETALYAEYDSQGPGATGPRAPFARLLTPEEAKIMSHGNGSV